MQYSKKVEAVIMEMLVVITQLIHSQSPIPQPSCLVDQSFLIPWHALRTSLKQLHYPTLLIQLLLECPAIDYNRNI